MYSALKDCAIDPVINQAAAAQTDADSSVLDMQGFTGVCFVLKWGDVTATSALELQVFGNTANSTSSPTPVQITSSDVTFTAGATDADNKLMIVDIPRWNPTYRYAFCRAKRGTANAVIDGAVAIRYNGKNCPVTQGSGVVGSSVLASKG